jgi:hypothetical protein
MGTVQISRIRVGALFKFPAYPRRLCTLVYKSIPQWGGSGNLFVKIMYVASDGMFYAHDVNVRYYVDQVGGPSDG